MFQEFIESVIRSISVFQRFSVAGLGLCSTGLSGSVVQVHFGVITEGTARVDVLSQRLHAAQRVGSQIPKLARQPVFAHFAWESRGLWQERRSKPVPHRKAVRAKVTGNQELERTLWNTLSSGTIGTGRRFDKKRHLSPQTPDIS